jgi:hypothetical protein
MEGCIPEIVADRNTPFFSELPAGFLHVTGLYYSLLEKQLGASISIHRIKRLIHTP